MSTPHSVRFRHPTVLEMLPLAEALPPEAWQRHEARRERFTRLGEEHEQNLNSRTNPHASHGPYPDQYYRDTNHFPAGWYGIEAGECWRADHGCVQDDGWTALEFACDAGCRVRTAHLEVVAPAAVGAWASVVPLRNGPVAAALLDPTGCLFRRPDEAGFWDRIVADCFDATARLVYADWLDDHDDPHAWAFRDPRPFRLGSLRLDWAGAMGRVDCGTPAERRTLWDFARITGRGSAVPFTLADGTPVPQFVAYLLGVTRIRADQRLTAADRTRLIGLARLLDLSLMADMIVGPDDEPICRVTDPQRTIGVLGELTERAAPVTPDDLAARIRDVNPPASVSPLRLVGLTHGFQGRAWGFGVPFEVGRHPTAGLRLDSADGSVSGRHAALSLDAAGWWVADRGSTNGTYRNGTRIGEQPAGPLRAGDTLQFGTVALRVGFAGVGDHTPSGEAGPDDTTGEAVPPVPAEAE